MADAASAAAEHVDLGRTVAAEALGRWQHDRSRLRAVELLAERRAERLRAERMRAEVRDLDEVAGQQSAAQAADPGAAMSVIDVTSRISEYPRPVRGPEATDLGRHRVRRRPEPGRRREPAIGCPGRRCPGYRWGHRLGCSIRRGRTTPSGSASGTSAAPPVSTPFADLFQKAEAKYGVDATLLATVAKHESSFNPRAVSHAGAQGLMQLMPGTARGLGVADPFDPAQAIDGAARLLRDLEREFGRTDLALAAYNAGPGAVHKYNGIPCPTRRPRTTSARSWPTWGTDDDHRPAAPARGPQRTGRCTGGRGPRGWATDCGFKRAS